MIRLKIMISGGQGKKRRLSGIVFKAILSGVFFCLMLIPASGSFVFTITPPQQLDLAETLFDEAEYDAAITEYRRFVAYFPDHSQADYARFQVALAYFMRHDFEKALSLFENLYSRGVENKNALAACFMASRCYLYLGRPDPAVAVLEQLLSSVNDRDVRDKAYYQIGWIYLEAGEVLEAAATTRAGEYFAGISDENKRCFNVRDLTGRLQELAIDGKGPLLSRKDPKLSGVLAVFPGAGYVYCGRYHDALMSFLFNTGMAYAAYEAFYNDLEALGTLISLVGMGFYGGSIYGSVSAAHKYNRKISREFLDSLKDIRFEVLPVINERGAMVRLRVPF